jgi:hypothetical protein
MISAFADRNDTAQTPLTPAERPGQQQLSKNEKRKKLFQRQNCRAPRAGFA